MLRLPVWGGLLCVDARDVVLCMSLTYQWTIERQCSDTRDVALCMSLSYQWAFIGGQCSHLIEGSLQIVHSDRRSV